MTVVLTGSEALSAALTALQKAGDTGARDGIVAGSRKLVGLTRAHIGGEPRWSRRGKGRTGPAVDTGRRPVHVPRGGGPGSLTGGLKRNVHSLRPRRDLAGWSGKVSAMGGKQGAGFNLYAARVEQAYPFLRPAVAEFDRVAPAIFESAWAARIGRI